MKKEDWIWMPHPAHFCCASRCFFRLATYVGKYIVSTVGEMEATEIDRKFNPDSQFAEVGLDRLYETMVFHARKSNCKACKYEIIVKKGEIEAQGYNSPEEAMQGHMELCEKYSNII